MPYVLAGVRNSVVTTRVPRVPWVGALILISGRAVTSYTPDGIAYDRAGPRGEPPVVLVHAGVADRRMWDPIWPELTRERDAVRVDLRGFGDSAARPAGPVSPADDVLGVLADAGVSRCHLVGASFGAGVAVETALTRPSAVASLLLAAPGGALLAEVTPELRTFFDAEGAALERGDLDAAVEANLTWWVEGPRRRASEVEPAVRDLVARMQRRAFEVTAGWDDVEQKELEPPALERLGEIAAPALVLVGGLDLDAVQAAAGRVVDGVAGARRVDWPDAGHLPALERPADFLALLRGWAAPLPGALLAGVDQANRQRAVDPLQQRAGERRMQRRRPAMRWHDS